MLPPSFLSASPLFVSFSKCSKLIPPPADGGEEEDSTEWSYSCSLFWGDGKGWRWGRKMSSFFISLRSKEFKRCPSLSVSLGAEVWTGTGASLPVSGQPVRGVRGLAHGRVNRSPLCRSVGALLEVIFESALPSLPSWSPTVSFQSNQRKWKSKWLTQRGGRRRGILHSP